MLHNINPHDYYIFNYYKGSLKMLKQAALIALLGMSASAMAGPWQVKVGGSVIDPTDHTNVANVGGVKATGEAAFTPSVEYFFSDNISTELLLATPVNHGVNINGAKALEIKQLPPVLTAKYHFKNSTGFTPYVGVGGVAFIAWDEAEQGELTGTKVKVKEDFGFAAQVGFNFKPESAKNYGIYFDLRYAQISPEVDVKLNGAPHANFDLDINPLVYTAGYSYRF